MWYNAMFISIPRRGIFAKEMYYYTTIVDRKETDNMREAYLKEKARLDKFIVLPLSEEE